MINYKSIIDSSKSCLISGGFFYLKFIIKFVLNKITDE